MTCMLTPELFSMAAVAPDVESQDKEASGVRPRAKREDLEVCGVGTCTAGS